MSILRVQKIRHTGSDTDVIDIANDGTCNVNLSNRQGKNLVVNGACLISQRATSNTAGGDGYYTVDRFYYYNQGIDNDVTKAQADVASGTTPYSLGFRKSFKLTNGNQSGGVGTNDMIVFDYKLEAQDIANSGWNYTSSSSFITLSFWVKSSVAQNFYVRLKTSDGTAQNYTFETGSLTQDTWTKITKTIEGNSNLQFNNDNEEGLDIEWSLFRGTDSTGSMSLNAWAADNTSIRTPDQTSTWYTTNNATFEITGVQLEVSDHATEYDHKSYADELQRCKRYFQIVARHHSNGADFFALGSAYGTSQPEVIIRWETEMRTAPSLEIADGTNYYQFSNAGNALNFNNFQIWNPTTRSALLFKSGGPTTTNGMVYRAVTNDANAYIYVTAEL